MILSSATKVILFRGQHDQQCVKESRVLEPQAWKRTVSAALPLAFLSSAPRGRSIGSLTKNNTLLDVEE